MMEYILVGAFMIAMIIGVATEVKALFYDNRAE